MADKNITLTLWAQKAVEWHVTERWPGVQGDNKTTMCGTIAANPETLAKALVMYGNSQNLSYGKFGRMLGNVVEHTARIFPEGALEKALKQYPNTPAIIRPSDISLLIHGWAMEALEWGGGSNTRYAKIEECVPTNSIDDANRFAIHLLKYGRHLKLANAAFGKELGKVVMQTAAVFPNGELENALKTRLAPPLIFPPVSEPPDIKVLLTAIAERKKTWEQARRLNRKKPERSKTRYEQGKIDQKLSDDLYDRNPPGGRGSPEE